MKCKRCRRDIEKDAPANAVICGNCADDLRREEEAMNDEANMAGQSEAEAKAMADASAREAYEDAQQEAHFDDGNGYRYI